MSSESRDILLSSSPNDILSELLNTAESGIERAVRATDPMALRGLIYQLTGDESLERVKTRKSRIFFADAWIPATDEDLDFICKKATSYLVSLRDSGAVFPELGPADRLQKSLELACGEPIPHHKLDYWIEEGAFDPWARAPRPLQRAVQPDMSDFRVLVIGSGMGGITAAVQLKHRGVAFCVFEKNPEVAGTWHENRYPGCRVDTPSRAYTHIFGANFIYTHPFSPQWENENYFNWVTDKYGVRESIHFNTEVETLTWIEDEKVWLVTASGPDGRQFDEKFNAVICATGLLSRPSLPDFEGMGTFSGPEFHTSCWPDGLALSDKTVAVVGTGATGYQMIPELALKAKRVIVVQRKPQWIFPIPGYTSPLPADTLWLDRNLPFHINFMRFRTNWVTGESAYKPIFSRDPEWKDPLTCSAFNQTVRDERVAYIRSKFSSRPDLAKKMVPPHPPFSARPILVDEEYNVYDALLRDNVELISDGIQRITEKGFISGGREVEVDCITYATGFKANDLLWPMEIRGTSGRRIEDLWSEDGARAYTAGSMLPGFPNLFILYGPNTNPGAGGGIVNHEEMVTRFAIEQMQRIVAAGKRSVAVTDEAYRRYNRELDLEEKGKTYVDLRAGSFFINEHNRSSVMCPFSPTDLWDRLNNVPEGDLVFE